VASLFDKINDRSVLFALLKVIQSQPYGFVPPQPAGKQQCQQCAVAFSFQALMIGCLPKHMTLFCCEPVPETHAQLLDAFHPANRANCSKPETRLNCCIQANALIDLIPGVWSANRK
jgi:hypothetical protein